MKQAAQTSSIKLHLLHLSQKDYEYLDFLLLLFLKYFEEEDISSQYHEI